MQEGLAKRFIKNLAIAFFAQGISFLLSCMMSLLVPKILGVEQFAYWQLFVLYSGYFGCFHFGLSDGIYLRYGGTDLDKMDKSVLNTQFWIMICWQTLLCLLTGPAILALTDTLARKFIWVMTGIYILVGNTIVYWGNVFQAANRTTVYSKAIVISKASYILVLFVLLILRPSEFWPFVILYVITQGMAAIYILYQSRQFLVAKPIPFQDGWRHVKKNVGIGINLMIAGTASGMMLGAGKILVDHSMGIEAFGVVSLAISLTNFFITFIMQTSMVMFPALRKLSMDSAKKLFFQLRDGLSYVALAIYVAYIPMKAILEMWLPLYKMSFFYMALLLPICVFDGKMQMLYSTYLKVLRKERALLVINVSSFCISVLLCSLGAFLIKEISVVAIAMTTAIVFRSILADFYLSKQWGIPIDKNLFWELILTILFVIANVQLPGKTAFVLTLVGYMVFLFVRRTDIADIVKAVLQRFAK